MEHELVHSWLSDHWYVVIFAVEAILLVWQIIGVIHDCKKYKYNWHTDDSL